MLEIIKKLDSGTVRGLIVATIPLIVLIASFFGVDEALFSTQLEGIGEKIVALVSLAGVAWAAYARVFKPTPPLTETAAKLTQERLVQEAAHKQGGYAGVGLLGLTAALSLALVALAGCAQLGLQTSGTFNDRLAGGYSLVTAVSDGAGIMLDSKVRAAEGKPDRDALVAAAKVDAQSLLDQARTAKDALDSARALRGLDFKAAEQRLASTLLVLEALQRYLEEAR
jgi:hypothetical protein